MVRIGAYKVFIGPVLTDNDQQMCDGKGVLIYKNGNLYEG